MSEARTPEEHALALLRLLASEDGVSTARAAKRLGLGASELQRVLVALGDDPRFDGLALVEQREESRPSGPRVRLWLSARGRALCDGMLDDGMLDDGMLDDGMLDYSMPQLRRRERGSV